MLPHSCSLFPLPGESIRNTWACRRRWPSGTRPTRTQPPRVAPSPRPSLWCDCGGSGALPAGSPVLSHNEWLQLSTVCVSRAGKGL